MTVSRVSANAIRGGAHRDGAENSQSRGRKLKVLLPRHEQRPLLARAGLRLCRGWLNCLIAR
jgi:hypothetical protein